MLEKVHRVSHRPKQALVAVFGNFRSTFDIAPIDNIVNKACRMRSLTEHAALN